MKYQGVKSLFKYKSIDKKFMELLQKKSLYAPVLEQLNDPFEDSLYLNEAEYNQKIYHELISEIEKASDKELNSKTINSLNKLFMNNDIDIKSINIMKSKKDLIFRNLAKKIGVISFSSENNSLLLWSHYANSHRGICLEFERNQNNDLGNDRSCFPVQYSSFIKDIEFTNDNDFIYSEYFRYKCDIWDYEKEWRLLTSQGRNAIPFPGKLIKVYFGLETSDEDAKTIMHILGDTIKYVKAKKVDNNYEIRFKDYK